MIEYVPIGKLLEVYAWLIAAIIATYAASISLFYQRKFDENPEYYFFVVPLLLLIIAILQIFDHELPLTNLAGTIAGLMFFLLSFRLYLHMTEGGS
jgi:ABC-type dipeptide/oligopeptide/nickel transport system permease subunit